MIQIKIQNCLFYMLLLLSTRLLIASESKNFIAKAESLLSNDAKGCTESLDKDNCDEEKNSYGPYKCLTNSDCKTGRVCFLYTCTENNKKCDPKLSNQCPEGSVPSTT